jgi:copper chaperone CopZ
VPDIGCDACRRAIEGEVSAVAGVRLVQVDVSGRTVLVEGAAAEEAVAAAIEAAGYEVAGRRAD